MPGRAPSRFCPSAGPRAADGRSERRGRRLGRGWAGHLRRSLLLPWPGARAGTSAAVVTPGPRAVFSLVPAFLSLRRRLRWPRFLAWSRHS